jgi:hypothetical protein
MKKLLMCIALLLCLNSYGQINLVRGERYEIYTNLRTEGYTMTINNDTCIAAYNKDCEMYIFLDNNKCYAEIYLLPIQKINYWVNMCNESMVTTSKNTWTDYRYKLLWKIKYYDNKQFEAIIRLDSSIE